jgi:hypothetical protein
MRVEVALSSDVGGDCAVLQDPVTATLDGMPLEVVSRGGYASGNPSAGQAASCVPPSFRIATGPSNAVSELSLSDGTATIAASVASLRTAREFSVDAVRRGALVRFAWSVSADTVQSDGQVTPLPGVAWQPDQGIGFELGAGFGVAGATLDGTALVATIPADATTGSGMFLFAAVLSPTFVTCGGVARCFADAPPPPPLRAAIAP